MACTEQDAANVERILETTNFYDILQIPNNATDDQIKSAHKKLALLIHPDKNNYPKAKDAFVVVRKATAVLLDKEKRKEYDEYLHSPRGYCSDKFDLSDEAIDAIFLTAGVASVVGIAAGLFALYNLFTGSKKKEDKETLK